MRIAALVLLAMGLMTTLAHGAELRLNEPKLISGSEVSELSILLALAPGEAVSGLQFELAFDSNTVRCDGFSSGAAAGASGKMVSANAVQPGRFRVIVAGFNQTTISTGPIAVVKLKLPESGAALQLENPVLSDPNGHAVAAKAVGLNVGSGGSTETPPPARPMCGCAGDTPPEGKLGDVAMIGIVATALLIARDRRANHLRP